MVALETSLNFADFAAALVAAWLVLALGAWIRSRVDEVASARVAVIGDRSFAMDLAHEFDAARVHDHRLAGWIGGPGETGNGLVWLGSLREVRRIVVEQDIELLVVAPGDDLSMVEERAVFETVADFCLDLPVKMIAANQLYEQLLDTFRSGRSTPLGSATSCTRRSTRRRRPRSVSSTSSAPP